MALKSSPSLIKRFSGATGRERFIKMLQEQELVAGNEQLARKMAELATRRELPANHEFLSQGGVDNEIYFILCGSVSVKVNGREVATRGAGDHVGEMALLDTTARRSASVCTLEPTVIAKVAEPKFTEIAKVYPDLWRRAAVALARRLRERTRTLKQETPRSARRLDSLRHEAHKFLPRTKARSIGLNKSPSGSVFNKNVRQPVLDEVRAQPLGRAKGGTGAFCDAGRNRSSGLGAPRRDSELPGF